VDGAASLHIRAAGSESASWRCPVKLPPGRYTLTGRIRTAGVSAGNGDQPMGARLRISGSAEQKAGGVTGTSPWTLANCDFEVTAGTAETVLVCELRSPAGEAWFDEASLRVRRR
jgi:hypothetical protein